MYYLLGIGGNRDTAVKNTDTFWWGTGARTVRKRPWNWVR